MATTDVSADPLTIAGTELRSRLLLGTGGFRSLDALAAAIEASRRRARHRRAAADRPRRSAARSSTCSTRAGVRLLPNTAGCFTARDAVLTAKLAREAFETDWVKLEVIGDERTLLPDAPALLEAAEELVDEGFTVLPYTNDDPILARRLEDVGCAAVMPLGSPIGSGMGLLNTYNLRLIRERAEVPVILDAGRRHGVRRRAGDGARLRRRAVRERDLARRGPGGDGPGDPARHRGRPARVPRGPHPAPALRAGLDARRGRGRVLSARPYTLLDVFTDRPLAGQRPRCRARRRRRRGRDHARVRAGDPARRDDLRPDIGRSADYRNRIWTLAEEIPFAGHPSLGTAVAVALERGEDEAEYRQQTQAGIQPVTVRRDGDRAVRLDPARPGAVRRRGRSRRRHRRDRAGAGGRPSVADSAARQHRPRHDHRAAARCREPSAAPARTRRPSPPSPTAPSTSTSAQQTAGPRSPRSFPSELDGEDPATGSSRSPHAARLP